MTSGDPSKRETEDIKASGFAWLGDRVAENRKVLDDGHPSAGRRPQQGRGRPPGAARAPLAGSWQGRAGRLTVRCAPPPPPPPQMVPKFTPALGFLLTVMPRAVPPAPYPEAGGRAHTCIAAIPPYPGAPTRALPPRRPTAPPGRGSRLTWDVGVGALLVGQPVPAAQRGLRAAPLHQEGAGHGAAVAAPSPAALRPAPAAPAPAGPRCTRCARGGGKFPKVAWKVQQETWAGACVLQT